MLFEQTGIMLPYLTGSEGGRVETVAAAKKKKKNHIGEDEYLVSHLK